MSALDDLDILMGNEPDRTNLEYREIPGFPKYFACSNGYLYSDRFNKFHELQPDERKEDGRKRYTLKHSSGKYVRKYGSYFVLIAFIGPKPDGMEACHGNGNCLDDSKGNLRWDTPIANRHDMLIHGTRCMGETRPRAKLTREEADEIRISRSSGTPLSILAAKYNVTPTTISDIACGRSRKSEL